MSGEVRRSNDSERRLPFDQAPWPGEPGYQAPSSEDGPKVSDESVAAESVQVKDSRRAHEGGSVQPAEAAIASQHVEAVEGEAAEGGSSAGEHAEGEFKVPAGCRVIEGVPLGEGLNVAVAVSRFNGRITSSLLTNALAELERLGVAGERVTIMPVPGAFELPLAAAALAKSRRFHCVVALGCVVKGETPHFDYVAGEAASGLMLAGLETGVPVAFGVLTVDTVEQAEARLDKGAEAARTALEMADALARTRALVGG